MTRESSRSPGFPFGFMAPRKLRATQNRPARAWMAGLLAQSVAKHCSPSACTRLLPLWPCITCLAVSGVSRANPKVGGGGEVTKNQLCSTKIRASTNGKLEGGLNTPHGSQTQPFAGWAWFGFHRGSEERGSGASEWQQDRDDARIHQSVFAALVLCQLVDHPQRTDRHLTSIAG